MQFNVSLGTLCHPCVHKLFICSYILICCVLYICISVVNCTVKCLVFYKLFTQMVCCVYTAWLEWTPHCKWVWSSLPIFNSAKLADRNTVVKSELEDLMLRHQACHTCRRHRQCSLWPPPSVHACMVSGLCPKQILLRCQQHHQQKTRTCKHPQQPIL